MQEVNENVQYELSKDLRGYGRICSNENLETVKNLIEQYDGVKFILSNEPKIGRLITIYSVNQENPYLPQVFTILLRVNKKTAQEPLSMHSTLYEEKLRNDPTQNSYFLPGSINPDQPQNPKENREVLGQYKGKKLNRSRGQQNQNKPPPLPDNVAKNLQLLGAQIRAKKSENYLSLDQDVEEFLSPNQSEASFALITVDFESFLTHKGNINIPSELGMAKIQNGGISETLHYFFKPEKPFKDKDASQIAMTKKITGIPNHGGPGAIQLTQENVTKVREAVTTFLGPPNAVLLVAKGIQMEKDLLFRWMGLDKSYLLVEFADTFRAAFQTEPSFDVLHKNRTFDFCGFHQDIKSEQKGFHCALDDAIHLAKIFLDTVEKKEPNVEIEITINGQVISKSKDSNEYEPSQITRNSAKKSQRSKRSKKSNTASSMKSEDAQVINIEIQ